MLKYQTIKCKLQFQLCHKKSIRLYYILETVMHILEFEFPNLMLMETLHCIEVPFVNIYKKRTINKSS